MKLRVEPAQMELTASGRLAGVPEGGPAATKSDAAARWSAQRTCSAACSLATTYVAGSIQRDRAQFCMGLCTVSLVVSFAALLIGAIGLTPTIFYRLAEDNSGSDDMLLTPEFGAAGAPPFLNFTDIDLRLSGNADVLGATPRWAVLGRVANREQPTRNTTTIILALDSEQESGLQLGSSWGRRPLGLEEAYVSTTALKEIGVRGAAGERVLLTVDFVSLLNTFGGAAGGTGGGNGTAAAPSAAAASALLALLGVDAATLGVGGTVSAAELLDAIAASLGVAVDTSAIPGLDLIPVDTTAVTQGIAAVLSAAVDLQMDATVVEGVEFPRGKWSSLLGNVVMLEAKFVAQWLREQLSDALDLVSAQFGPLLALGDGGLQDALATARAGVAALDYALMQQFALAVTVQAAGRLDIYIRDSNNVLGAMKEFSTSVGASLGHEYFFAATLPMATSLNGLRFIKLFLDVTFQTVVFILACLSGVVVYALMLGDTEAKTYEYGMLRALGMQNGTLVAVLGVQTAAFALPGILIGLTAAAVLYAGIAAGVGAFASAPISLGLPGLGVAYGVAYGILVPAIATVGPIRRALGGTLRDALDLYHSGMHDVTVVVLRLAEVGLSPTQTVTALTLILIGFVTYYLVPLSFVLSRIDIFLAILNAILMAMVLGLTILTQMGTPALERGVLAAMLCRRPDARLQHLITKNLSGHRSRNRKTAYIVALSTAFLLFAGAMVGLQSESIRTNVRNFIGADLLILSPGGADAAALPQAELEAYLATQTGPGGLISAFTFVTYAMSDVLPARFTANTNLAGTPLLSTRVFGLQENFLDATYAEDFTIITEKATAGVPAALSGAGGGGGVRGGEQWTDTNAIRALYQGAGELTLPVEGDIQAVPPPPVSGEASFPLYVCVNASSTDGDGAPTPARFLVNASDPSAGREASPRFADYHECVQRCGEAASRDGSTSPLLCVASLAVSVPGLNLAAEVAYRQYVDMLVSEAVRDAASVTTDTPMLFRVTASTEEDTAFIRQRFLGKVRGMVQKLPAFFFSSYQQAAAGSPQLLRMQDFGRVLLQAEQSLLQAVDSGTALDAASETQSGGEVDEEAGEGQGGSGEGNGESTPQEESGSGGQGEQTGAVTAIPGMTASPAFLPSLPAWGAPPAAYTSVNGSQQFASELVVVPIPQFSGELGAAAGGETAVRNVSAVVDDDTATGLAWDSTVDAARLTLDLRECPAVSGLRVWFPGTSSTQAARYPRRLRLQAGGSLTGPWSTRGTLALQVDDAGAGFQSVRLSPFSARYWRLLLEGGEAGLVLGEVQLRLATAALCEADASLVDDRALGLPKQRLLISMADRASRDDTTLIANALKSIIRSSDVQVQDTEALLASTASALLGLEVFFYFIAALAVVLAFFASWLSFTANVRENARELAVLRALGLTIHQVTRVYVYEALSVVLASFIMGSVVGMLVSITLTLQFNLFTEQPFQFIFPYALFFGTLVMLVLVSILSSYYPALNIAQVVIAQTLKGT